MMKNNKKMIVFFVMSAVVGFINGLLGGGGGMLCVPIFKIMLNLSDKEAHATSILVTAILSISTLIVYITTLKVDFFYAPYLSFGVLIGGFFGAILMKKLKNEALNIIFVCVMLIAGIKSIFW